MSPELEMAQLARGNSGCNEEEPRRLETWNSSLQSFKDEWVGFNIQYTFI